MNILEDRLRDALRERAARSSIDPDAWARTLARTGSRRRGRAPGWSRFLIPAAAAAAVIAIVVGATALTGHEGLRGAGGTGSVSPSSPAAPAPPGRNDYLIQQDPPVSAIVLIDRTRIPEPVLALRFKAPPELRLIGTPIAPLIMTDPPEMLIGPVNVLFPVRASMPVPVTLIPTGLEMVPPLMLALITPPLVNGALISPYPPIV